MEDLEMLLDWVNGSCDGDMKKVFFVVLCQILSIASLYTYYYWLSSQLSTK